MQSLQKIRQVLADRRARRTTIEVPTEAIGHDDDEMKGESR